MFAWKKFKHKPVYYLLHTTAYHSKKLRLFVEEKVYYCLKKPPAFLPLGGLKFASPPVWMIEKMIVLTNVTTFDTCFFAFSCFLQFYWIITTVF